MPHLVVRLGMRYLITIALAVQVVACRLVMALMTGFDLWPQALAFPVYVAWTTGVFFMAGLTLGNLNALSLEPVGHIAGMAASVSGSIATVLAVALAVPVGLAFDGTPLPLAVGVALFCAVGYCTDEDDSTLNSGKFAAKARRKQHSHRNEICSPLVGTEARMKSCAINKSKSRRKSEWFPLSATASGSERNSIQRTTQNMTTFNFNGYRVVSSGSTATSVSPVTFALTTTDTYFLRYTMTGTSGDYADINPGTFRGAVQARFWTTCALIGTTTPMSRNTVGRWPCQPGLMIDTHRCRT